MMDIFKIGAENLNKNDPAEAFYICEECEEKHPVSIYKTSTVFCGECAPHPCSCKPITIGSYACKRENYLYSIDGRQII